LVPQTYDYVDATRDRLRRPAALCKRSTRLRSLNRDALDLIERDLQMRRREFIAGLGGAAAWPLAARAQQSARPVVAYLSVLTEDVDRPLSSAFRRGLGEHGYVEGRNIEIFYRYSARGDRLRDIVEESVHNRISLIYVAGGPAQIEAVRSASETVPIVFVSGTDPVESGLVASLNRRGGNVTGIYYRGQELTATTDIAMLHGATESAATAAPGKDAEAADTRPRQPIGWLQSEDV
jgi:ABC transporter substrate binding protein